MARLCRPARRAEINKQQQQSDDRGSLAARTFFAFPDFLAD